MHVGHDAKAQRRRPASLRFFDYRFLFHRFNDTKIADSCSFSLHTAQPLRYNTFNVQNMDFGHAAAGTMPGPPAFDNKETTTL